MALTTSKAVHVAQQDTDLRNRLNAAAALAGIPDPAWWVERNIYALVVAKINGDAEDTISSVFEYAVNTYVPTPRPGENPAAVTDTFLAAAVAAVAANQAAQAA